MTCTMRTGHSSSPQGPAWNAVLAGVKHLRSLPQASEAQGSQGVIDMAVQILKQDWPSKWPTFITDIVSASKTSELLCENSMVILKLLSEEIFDFSRGELTTVCSLCQAPASPCRAPPCLACCL